MRKSYGSKQKEGCSVDKKGRKGKKKEKEKEGKQIGENERKPDRKGRKEEEEKGKKIRRSNGPSIKVDPRITSYVWVPKSWSFVKLHKVENFPTRVISSLKII